MYEVHNVQRLVYRPEVVLGIVQDMFYRLWPQNNFLDNSAGADCVTLDSSPRAKRVPTSAVSFPINHIRRDRSWVGLVTIGCAPRRSCNSTLLRIYGKLMGFSNGFCAAKEKPSPTPSPTPPQLPPNPPPEPLPKPFHNPSPTPLSNSPL